MKRLLLSFILLSLFSCSPQKRLYHLLKSHPELVRHDTVWKRDTIVTKRVTKDTIFKTQITKDTIIIKEKNLEIKYYNDGKTTYLKGICDTIKIIKNIPVYINNVNAVKEVHVIKWWDYAAYVISILALVFLFLDIYIRRK